MIYFPDAVLNNPALAGNPALPKQYFGGNSRYAIAPVHSRVNPHVTWFIWDADSIQHDGLPEVIGMYDSLDEALARVDELTSLEEEAAKVARSYTLSIRKTPTYRDAWRHLDNEQVVATAVTLQESSVTTDDEDPCEPTRTIRLIEVTDHVDGDKPTIIAAIRDTMSHSGCTHDWDCCGCWHTSVSEILPLTYNPRQFVVILNSSRNY